MENNIKKVIVTGVSGQAGSYFVEYLLKNTEMEIYGMVRRLSVKNHSNLTQETINNPRFHLFSGDLNDSHSIYKNIEEIKPDYFINCAAQSFVAESWISPANTFEVDSVAIIHILEAIRKLVPNCRFINFGSSEEFGDVVYSPQDEKHPPRARSIYGAAKIAARQIIKVYRESYGLYCIQPWNFNYESKRRGIEFLTKKVTKGVARIYHSIQNNEKFEPISLGGYSSERDWSHCEDIVDGVWKMLNQELYNAGERFYGVRHDDTKELSKHLKEYVFSSNETHSIRKFVEKAFCEAKINGNWSFIGTQNINHIPPENEIFRKDTGEILVKIDPQFYRPADVVKLWGNSGLARQELNWQPKYNFDDLVREMVNFDIENYKI